MNQIEQAIKRVSIIKKGNEHQFGTCFPFHWDGEHTWVVTSAHVIKNAKLNSIKVEKTNAQIEYNGNPIVGFDLAILKIRRKIELPKEIKFQQPPHHTVNVKVVGWPARSGIFQGQGTANKTGIYLDPSLTHSPNTEKLEVLLRDDEYQHGLSGSPIIKELEGGTGRIIGVLREQVPNKPNKGYAVSIEALQIIVKKKFRRSLPPVRVLRPSLNICIVCAQGDLRAYTDFLKGERYTLEYLLNEYIGGGKQRPWQVYWLTNVASKSDAFLEADVIIVIGGRKLTKQLAKEIDKAIKNREAKQKRSLCVACQVTYNLPHLPEKASRRREFQKIRKQYLIDLSKKEKIGLFDNVIKGVDHWWMKIFSDKYYNQTANGYLKVIRNADENKLSKRTLYELVEDSKKKVAKRKIPKNIQQKICEAADNLGARPAGPYLTEKQFKEIDRILLDWERTVNMKRRKRSPIWVRWVLRANGLHPQVAKK